MKELGLVNTQPSSHVYKKADQSHEDISNLFDCEFDVRAPNKA